MVYLFLPEYTQLDVFGLNNPFTKRCEQALLVHYFSKMLDFCDTIFMIVRRRHRQVSFLHVFHHASILPVWGIVLNSGFGGSTAGFGAMANSFIHIVMYSHYFVTSFGIKNPFKKYITQLQLAQFAIDFVHAIVVQLGKDTLGLTFSNYPRRLAT